MPPIVKVTSFVRSATHLGIGQCLRGNLAACERRVGRAEPCSEEADELVELRRSERRARNETRLADQGGAASVQRGDWVVAVRVIHKVEKRRRRRPDHHRHRRAALLIIRAAPADYLHGCLTRLQ